MTKINAMTTSFQETTNFKKIGRLKMSKFKVYLLTAIFAVTLMLVSAGQAVAQTQDVFVVNPKEKPVQSFVVNEEADPVPVRDVDNPARHPYRTQLVLWGALPSPPTRTSSRGKECD